MSALRAPRAIHTLCLCALGLGVALCARPVTAALITTGVYQLSNHPHDRPVSVGDLGRGDIVGLPEEEEVDRLFAFGAWLSA